MDLIGNMYCLHGVGQFYLQLVSLFIDNARERMPSYKKKETLFIIDFISIFLMSNLFVK